MLKMNLVESSAELKKLKAKRVFLQIPEGLKTDADEIVEELEGKGFEVITGMDPCFGACDVKPVEAKLLGCDAILHIGHNIFVQENKTNIPIVYAPLKYELGKDFDETIKALATHLKKNKIKSIGLTTTIQFIEYLPKIKEELKKEKIKSTIGKGKRVENGQVLGCNYSSAHFFVNTKSVEAIIYFGDGLFHPLGISFSTKKEVITVNPFTKAVSSLGEEKNKFLKRRILTIEKAKEFKEVGILVTTKLGQSKIDEAEKIKRELEKSGKKAKIFVMDYISSEKLLGTNAEVLINTACPRIAFDDYASFKQPILNKNEVDYLLGKKKYEDYKIEEIY